ncbi:MAG: hypothetical protein K6T83_16975 [Alicyclobacillus sp.]|nr:hypothetical protein [Alicyclobacillus sp.]
MKEEEIVKIVSDILKLRRTILAALSPEEARQHFNSSRREALLGVKAILQHAIDWHDEQAEGKAHQEKSSRSIEITP